MKNQIVLIIFFFVGLAFKTSGQWETAGNDNGTLNGILGYAGANAATNTNPIRFHTQNAERMRLTNTGLLGIGTTSPTKKLQLDFGDALIRGINNFGTNGNTANLFLGDNNNYVRAEFGAGLRLGAFNANDAITIANGGNVGIGIGNGTTFTQSPNFMPTSMLHVNRWNPGDAFALFNISKTGFGNTYGFLVGLVGTNASDAVLSAQSGDMEFYTPLTGNTSPYPPSETNGNLRMTILSSSGNVGIATSNPLAKFQVERGSGKIAMGSFLSGAPEYMQNYVGWNASRSGSTFTFESDGANNGGALIATDIGGTMRFITVQSTGSTANQTKNDAQALTDTRMVIKGDGNVGVNTTSPIQRLDIKGKMHISDGVIQKGGSAITTTGDLGLYSLDPNTWMRFVTTSQPIKFYTDATDNNPIGQDEIMTLDPVGQVYIGMPSWPINNNTEELKLLVKGGILCQKVKVAMDGTPNWSWPDFVFSPDYKLKSLDEVEQFIKENNHLPDVPSACEITENGIDLAEMNAKLLQKVEELTLHVIAQGKEIEYLKNNTNANK